jgi:hypothetical protein
MSPGDSSSVMGGQLGEPAIKVLHELGPESELDRSGAYH